MATTPNYGWVMPDPTDFVTNLPADFELFGDAVDTDLAGLLGGTTGQVLIKDSNDDHDFSWANPATGGFVEIATGTLSGSAVNITSIPGTYKHLNLVIRDYRPTNDGDDLFFRVNNDSGANRYTQTLNTSETGASFNATSWQASQSPDNTIANNLTNVWLYDYANTDTWKVAFVDALSVNSTTTTTYNYRKHNSFYNQTGAITQINLFPQSSTIAGGTYFLYGVS